MSSVIIIIIMIHMGNFSDELYSRKRGEGPFITVTCAYSNSQKKKYVLNGLVVFFFLSHSLFFIGPYISVESRPGPNNGQTCTGHEDGVKIRRPRDETRNKLDEIYGHGVCLCVRPRACLCVCVCLRVIMYYTCDVQRRWTSVHDEFHKS